MVEEGAHALQALLLPEISVSHLRLRSHLRGHHTLQLVAANRAFSASSVKAVSDPVRSCSGDAPTHDDTVDHCRWLGVDYDFFTTGLGS